MGAFSFIRLALLGFVWALSIAVLGIAANDIALSVGSLWSFPSIALAASIVTHAIATPMIIISMARTGAAASRVIVELAWVGVLWLVWLLVAVVTTSTPVFTLSCGEYKQFFGDEAASECIQFTLLQVFAWLNSAVLLSYALLVFTLALVQNMRTKPTDKKTNAFYLDASLLSFRPKDVQTTRKGSNYATEKADLTLPMPVALTALSDDESKKGSPPSNPHAFWTERLSRTSSISSERRYPSGVMTGSFPSLNLSSQQVQPPRASRASSQRTSPQHHRATSSSQVYQSQASPLANSLQASTLGYPADKRKGEEGTSGHYRSTSRGSVSSMKTTTSGGSGHHRPAHVPSPLRKPVPFPTPDRASVSTRTSIVLTSEERKYGRQPFEQQRY